MHQSFVSTAAPPTGMGGYNDFTFPGPWYKPRPGGQADGNNPALCPTLHNRKSHRVSVPMLYPHTSPALRGQSKSNCLAPYPGYSTAIPVGGDRGYK